MIINIEIKPSKDKEAQVKNLVDRLRFDLENLNQDAKFEEETGK